MLSVETAREIIGKEIEKLDIPAEPKNLYEPVRYILSNGGKRIRPVMALLACNLFNDDYTRALYPALGIEVFHNFTLLHDDLMDNSGMRRNRPTVHIKWDPNTAILSGDVMSILANKLISMVDPEVIGLVYRMFNRTALEVCEGQMLDMEYTHKQNVSIPEYLEMIRLKTSVLIAASLGIGALAGGASEKEADLLYDSGLNLGMAFQLQDDLLDSFGDERLFGKKIGNDILTNKRTFLVIRAFEKAKGKELDELKKCFSVNEFDSLEKITRVISIFNKLGIKEETEAQVRKHFNLASVHLESLEIEPNRKNALAEFAESLMKREK